MKSNEFDVIIAGAGIAGITAAAAAAQRGLRVAMVSTGPGTFVFGAGCVEFQDMDPVAPLLENAANFFSNLTDMAGCGFRGGLDQIHYVPTILGSFQTVSMAPFYVWNGDPAMASRVAVVGIDGLSSFDSTFIAERLAFHASQLERGITYAAHQVKLSCEGQTFPGTLQLANHFDRDGHFRAELLDVLKPIAQTADLIILPGILGLKSGWNEIDRLERELGCMLCELPTLPPSIPGLRLYNRLESRLRKLGVEVFSGFPIRQLEIENSQFESLRIDSPARPVQLSAATLILATGPFFGELLGPGLHGFDSDLRPVDSSGTIIARNIFGAGAILRNSSAQGGNAMAILSGYMGGMHAAGAEAGVQYAHR